MCNRTRKCSAISKDEELHQVLRRNSTIEITNTKTIDNDKTSNATPVSPNGRIWLLIWLFNNIGLTLLNKAAFSKVDFKYPYYLSFIHMACNAIGAEIIMSMKSNKGIIQSILRNITPSTPSKEIDNKGYARILGFSIIFSLNIALGNVSLRYVSVNFNQVMRSLVPAITILIGRVFLKKQFTFKRVCSIIPIILGVCMACYGDMSYTMIGLNYTIAAIFLAAIKVIASNQVLTGDLKLHPMELLQHMAPLAMIQCLFLSYITGETQSIASRNDFNIFKNPYPCMVILCSGICAFSLNICSLTANKLTSPLTMCIAANVKQVLMIVISTIVFQTNVSVLNGWGIVLVLAGGALYSYVCFIENSQKECEVKSVEVDKV